jgi:hypothetical protein
MMPRERSDMNNDVQKVPIRSKRGSMIAMIIVVVAILILLGSAFLKASFYNHIMAKTIALGDIGYFGAEAAAEKWYTILRDVLTEPRAKYIGIDFPIDYGKEREYVLSVLERIRIYGNPDEDYHKTQLEKELEDLLTEKVFPPIITVNGERGNKIQANFARFEVHKASRTKLTETEAAEFGLEENQLAVKAKVGFVIVASVENAGGKTITANKRIFVEKDIYIPYFEQIQAIQPLYSVGDIMVIGDGSQDAVTIYGDVHSFGTFPEELRRPEQWGYGGVLARKNAKLHIAGNVYTRSFLRAGDYVVNSTPGVTWKNLVDNSEIRVTRDVFAQNIQTFTKGSQIYVYGNAFTLDDLEINAEDSIIAVNGSYLGLSTGAEANSGLSTNNHDESSALLNGGSLHYIHQEPSRSRIVVNGDVIIPGVGFRIAPDGTAEHAIESAGLITPLGNLDTEDYAAYWPAYRHDHKYKLIGRPYYDLILKDDMKGYTNILQAFNPTPRSAFGDINNPSIQTWIQSIKNIIQNNADAWNGATIAPSGYSNVGIPIKEPLAGYSSSFVGANDSIYWNSTMPGSATQTLSNHRPMTENLQRLPEFTMDGFLPSEIYKSFRWNGPDGEDGIVLYNDFNKEMDGTVMFDDAHEINQNVSKFWQHYWKPWGIDDWNTYFQVAKSYPALPPGLTVNSTTGDVAKFIEIFIQYDIPGALYTARLGGIKRLLENRLHLFARRDYPNDVNARYWETSILDDLLTTFDKAKRLKERAEPYVEFHGEQIAPGIVEENYKNLLTGFDPTKYYLLINDSPRRDIVIDGVFRGIILTKGRVILERGAKVYGSILATGRGRDGETDTLSKVDGSNLNVMEFPPVGWTPEDLEPLHKGDYAGILVDLNRGSGDAPLLDFYLGSLTDPALKDPFENSIFSAQRARIQLMEKFRVQGTDLFQVF